MKNWLRNAWRKFTIPFRMAWSVFVATRVLIGLISVIYIMGWVAAKWASIDISYWKLFVALAVLSIAIYANEEVRK